MVALSVGGRASLALSSKGRVACWGVTDYGECGPGLGSALPTMPVWIPGLDCINQIETDFVGLALDDAGTVHAWGTEFEGELGDGPGSPTPFGTPVPVLLPGAASFVVSTLGGGKAEVLGGIALWGGVALDEVFETPVLWAVPAGSRLFAGGGALYEIDANGKTRARGNNRFGKLGDGTRLDRTEYVEMATDARFARIIPGLTIACGITLEGSVYCWGSNFSGGLGIGTIPPTGTPLEETVVPVPTRLENLYNIVDVDLAAYGGCAMDATGDVSCWGANQTFRFLNDDGPDFLPDPVRIDDLSTARSVAVGDYHVCIQRFDDSIWCRGHPLQRGFYGDAPTQDATEMHFDFGGD